MSDTLAQLLRRNITFVALVAIAAGVGTAIVLSARPPTIQAEQLYTVGIAFQEPQTSDFQFDSFYALSAADLFADTLAGWLSSAETVVTAHEQAGLARPGGTLRRLGKVFDAQKISGQLVRLRFTVSIEEEAEKLLAEAERIAVARTDAYNAAGDQRVTFSVQPGEPLVVVSTPPTALAVLVAVVLGFLVGLNLVLLFESSQRTRAE